MKAFTALAATLLCILPALAQPSAQPTEVPIDEAEVFALAQRLADGEVDASTRIDEAFRLQVLWDYLSRITVPLPEHLTTGPETDNPNMQLTNLPGEMSLAQAIAGIASAQATLDRLDGGNSDNTDSAQANIEHWQTIEAHITSLLDFAMPTLIDDDGWEVAGLIDSVGELRDQLDAEENAAAVDALNADARARALREQYGDTLAQTLEVDGSAWAGEWTSSWGWMRLTLSGTSVTGNYEWDGGRLTGVLLPGGRVIEGRWYEPNQVGRFRFTLNADGRSFTGVYGSGDAEPTSDWSYARPAAE